MALPNQTFTTIEQLISYVNSVIVPNGTNAITGAQANNVFNGLANFIQSYLVNNSLVTIYSQSGNVYTLATPMTYITGSPTSIQWAGNVQNEYYITNATSTAIPISEGFNYTDQYGTVQTSIPARSSIHIAKAANQNWLQQNNLGGGGSGGLPPTAGHQGQSLFTDGADEGFWSDGSFPIYSGDANWINGVTWVNGSGYEANNFSSPKFLIFWNDASRYLLPSEYEYVENGFTILVGGFNSATANIFLFFRGANS